MGVLIYLRFAEKSPSPKLEDSIFKETNLG